MAKAQKTRRKGIEPMTPGAADRIAQHRTPGVTTSQTKEEREAAEADARARRRLTTNVAGERAATDEQLATERAQTDETTRAAAKRDDEGTGHTGPTRVRAKSMGFFNLKRRRVGDVFTVPGEKFDDTWMEEVPADTPERLTVGQEQLLAEHQRIKDMQQTAETLIHVSSDEPPVSSERPTMGRPTASARHPLGD